MAVVAVDHGLSRRTRSSHTASRDAAPAPGTVLVVDREGVVVACGEGAVRLTEVQPAGKPRMAAADFANGARIEVGEQFGAGSDGA